MKKLSIEEKAKRYDEAIKRAKECHTNGLSLHQSVKDVLEHIFPELKESEDERIRKEMIEILEKEAHDFPSSVIAEKSNSWIAWLEKQGDKDKLIKELGEYKVKYTQEVLEKHLNNMNNKDDERLRKTTIAFLKEFADKGYENAVECIDWLEKQGEQKSIDDLTSQEVMDIAVAKCFEQGEQKPFDYENATIVQQDFVPKTEPKFKVGDWVVRGNTVAQILDIQEQYYVGIDTNGNDFTSSRFLNDDKIHLWTIQDAKDGDVLATLDHILIFEKLLPKDGGVSYCHYDFGCSTPQFDFNKDNNWYFGKEAKVYPATKEQRVLLFQKMEEASFEWDAKKKELKKIEQKPADKVKPIFNVGDKIQYLKGCGTIMTIEKIENGEYIFANNMGHITIESGNKWYLVEQKPAWSEEDKTVLDNLIYSLANDRIGNNRDEYVDWLKSLKERYTWKPSGEQMHYLSWIANIKLGDSVVEQEVSKHLNELLEDLKKLREE